MKGSIFLSITAILMLFVSACGGSDTGSSVAELKVQYDSLMNQGSINDPATREVITKLAEAYEAEAKDQEGADNQAEYLYRAAEMHEGFGGNITKALEIYDNIMASYPDSKRAADALFKKGFLYHERLKDYEKAKAAYESFVEKYPDDELVDDAKTQIKYIGLSPEELFEIIQKKNDSIQQAGDSIE